jgi:superfamily II DNA or RNA helicase|tara:strand:+ start:509 stop:1684 length:1176 start_codon:yes stop_codon:yes gene_type:complete
MESIVSQINKIRDTEQRKALNAWARKKFVGSVIAGTGFGKSRVGVLAAEYVLTQESKSAQPSILILVPTVQLQDQFIEEFNKWEVPNDYIEVLCYQSAYKLIGNHYDLVICDEIHLGLSVQYRKFFTHNVYDKLLCMTATLPEEEEYKDLLGDIAPTVYTITLDKCVELGIVSPYKITCLPVKLTQEEREEYKTINNKFVYWKYKLGNFDAFNEAGRIMGDSFASAGEKQSAAQFYRCIRERKSIVDFAFNKITKFQALYQANTDKKILVFGGANDFTDRLCDSISPNAMSYHSKKSKKNKDLAIKSFKNGDINVLCSTKALNQGFDVPNANMGIICGITSKSLSMIQRVGRLVRFQEGKIGNIIILYVVDSQEEKWLINATKNLSNVIWK